MRPESAAPGRVPGLARWRPVAVRSWRPDGRVRRPAGCRGSGLRGGSALALLAFGQPGLFFLGLLALFLGAALLHDALLEVGHHHRGGLRALEQAQGFLGLVEAVGFDHLFGNALCQRHQLENGQLGVAIVRLCLQHLEVVLDGVVAGGLHQPLLFHRVARGFQKFGHGLRRGRLGRSGCGRLRGSGRRACRGGRRCRCRLVAAASTQTHRGQQQQRGRQASPMLAQIVHCIHLDPR